MKKILLISIVVFSLFSCSEEDVFIPPNVVTKGSENLPEGGVKLIGNFNNFDDEDELGFRLYSVNSVIQESIVNPVSGDNSLIIESGLYANREYSYQAFVRTQDSAYWGLKKKFISTGSKKVVFNKIEPSSGNFATEVKITTSAQIKNVSKEDVDVYFNDKIAYVNRLEDNAIICNVPFYEKKPVADIKINFLGAVNTTNLKFSLLKPEIESVSPTEVVFRDRVVITGKNFTEYGDYLNVYINDLKCVIYGKSTTSVEIVFPDEINKEALDIRLESNLQEVSLKNALNLKNPVIYKIPKEISLRETMVIEGDNFHPSAKYTKIFLDDNEHYMVNWVDESWYPKKIGATVQDVVFKDWKIKAKVVVSEVLETQEYDVTITDPIIKIKDSYDDILTDFNCDFNGINYVFGINTENEMVFHQFHKETDEFINNRKVKLPLNYVNSVVYNDGFIYLRNNAEEENYYRINMQNFDIEFLADYTETFNAFPFYVDRDKIIYIEQESSGTGKIGINIFQYTISANSWSSRFESTSIKVTRVFNNNLGKTYFLEGVYSAIKYIYSFDGTTFTKTNLELPAGFKDYFSEKIFDDNKFYFVESSGRANNTNRIMVLDLATNKFTEYTDFLFDDIDFLNSFKVDNYIYLESVNTSNYKRKLYKLDLNKI